MNLKLLERYYEALADYRAGPMHLPETDPVFIHASVIVWVYRAYLTIGEGDVRASIPTKPACPVVLLHSDHRGTNPAAVDVAELHREGTA